MMKTNGELLLLLVIFIAFWCVSGRLSADPSYPCALSNLVAAAYVHSPIIEAALAERDWYAADRDRIAGFFDPTLASRLGYESGDSAYGNMLLFDDTLPDDLTLSASITIPMRPGVYVSAGARESYLNSSADEDDAQSRTEAGLSIRTPLLKDRGFAGQQWRERQADAENKAADARLLAARQLVRHDVEMGYINLLWAIADARALEQAVARSHALLDEAQSLADLNAIAAYQIYPAQKNVAVNEADLSAARALVEQKRLLLLETIGCAEMADALEAEVPPLIEWLDLLPGEPECTIQEARRARGDYQSLVARLTAADAAVAESANAVKDELDLVAGIAIQGEDEHGWFGTETITVDERASSAIALVWRHSWGKRTERAELSESRAERRGLEAEQRIYNLALERELASLRESMASAQKRFALASQASKDAVKTLDAENERFRLGEGRSRNVLDAQQDYTETERLRQQTALEVLQARIGLHYATGYKEYTWE